MPDVPVRTATAPAPRRVAPRRPDLVAAAVTWALGVAALLALPVLAATDPAEPLDAPAALGAGWWAVVVALTLQAVAVAWARAAPRAALLAVAVVPVLASAAVPGSTAGLTSLAVVVAVYRAAVGVPLARVRAALLGVLVLLAVASGIEAARAADAPLLVLGAAVAQAVGVVALGLVPATVVGSRRAVLAAQAGEIRALAREQDALLASALAAQRTEMARELHDIAAHHLSGIALMASAIDRQIGTDPEAARRGLREVRDQSRVVLTDLRRLVGLLREDDGAETAALTLAAIPDLAAGPGAGEGVTVEVLGAAPAGAGVGPLAQLAAYRTVQEALANARSHAPGAPCRVTVDDRDPAAVLLTVRNGAPAAATAPAPQGGHGLQGMAERAALVGADLRHGPTPDGGWEVRLRLPRDRPTDPTTPTTPTEPTDPGGAP
jgi:signal transduction histidine kinase